MDPLGIILEIAVPEPRDIRTFADAIYFLPGHIDFMNPLLPVLSLPPYGIFVLYLEGDLTASIYMIQYLSNYTVKCGVA